MTKKELVKVVSAQVERNTGRRVPQTTVGLVYDELFNQIGQSLQRGEETRVQGFGTFLVKERVAREGRHPKTGKVIQLAARRKAACRFSLKLSAKAAA